jgi:hypothetical protein
MFKKLYTFNFNNKKLKGKTVKRSKRVVFCWAPFFLLFALSQHAFADIHKCVGTDGASSYTDQPCPTNLKENALEGSTSSLARQEAISDSCFKLNSRKTRCGRVYALLETNFSKYCTNPLLQYQLDHQRNQQYNRYRSQKERTTESVENLQSKIAEDPRCETVQKETWDFLKENFSKKIPEHDIKDIDYNVNAVAGRRPSTNTNSKALTITNTTVIHSTTVITN